MKLPLREGLTKSQIKELRDNVARPSAPPPPVPPPKRFIHEYAPIPGKPAAGKCVHDGFNFRVITGCPFCALDAERLAHNRTRAQLKEARKELERRGN